MNKEALKEVLRKHRAWLDGEEGGERADLRGANLRDANLRGANLSYANLSYANLCGADLCDANLRDADLCDANLCGADLRGANLCGANPVRANLRGANLCGANPVRANLRGANLRDADLSYANLCGANPVRANLRGADLRGARGNGIEVKSLHALKWDVVWTDKVLAIGCMQYDIEEWLSFTDEQIAEMDPEALDFMNENRDLILKLIGRDDPRWIDRERKEEKAREIREGERDTARERGEIWDGNL